MYVKFCSKTGKLLRKQSSHFHSGGQGHPPRQNNVAEEQLECVYNTHCFLQLSKFGAYEFKQ